MPVLVYDVLADAEAAHETVLNVVLVSSNLGMPEDWAAIETGSDGRFYVLAPDYNFNSAVLDPDDTASEMPSEAAANAIASTISQAREVGAQLIDGFLGAAHAGGVNDTPGVAGAVTRALSQVTQDCQTGALHAALDNLDLLLTTPELEREGYPYTSDAALAGVRAQLAAVVGRA